MIGFQSIEGMGVPALLPSPIKTSAPLRIQISLHFVSGKYIQKNEISLKANNLITVIPNFGSEYKIIFDVLINKFKRNTWYSVLLLTADKNSNGHDSKYGDRNPAVWVYNDQVWVSSSINEDPNLYTAPAYTTLGKWMKIEICQHMIDNKGRDSFVDFHIQFY